MSNIKTKEEKVNSSKAIFEKYKQINSLSKEIIDEFIEEVLIGKVNPENNTRDIDVIFNFIRLD
jgi:hypothetical protein